MNKTAYILLATVSTATLSVANGASSEKPESPFNEVGFRFGVDAGEDVSLTSYELYETSDPQWSWDLSDNISTGIGYEAAVGVVAGEGETSAYVHFGFTLEFAHEDIPVTIIAASGPSLYTEDTFGDYDIGGHIHFTSSIGLKWQMCESWAVEYRLQHTSNAGLEDDNPGLDIHAVALSYSF